MLEKTTIARPYAQAVFELAQESGAVAEWSSALDLLKRIVSDEQMQVLFNNPKVSDQQLQNLVIEIAGDALGVQPGNFVKILVAASRLQYATQVAELFEAMRAEAEGTVDVEVSAAYELDQAQQDGIANGISKRLGKKVSINVNIDETLIGGAIIRAGDSVIDASVRGRLTKLGNDLN
ncbi:MAG: F0F1 ATP synthase subunit delta [Gammaproteobacteria bacterium]|nr:F0F1 ATP synthase subunit delta [Gammaproteobacteria bacterium]